MNNDYRPCFYRMDSVFIPSYVKLSWFQEWITLEICYFWHCSCQALELHLDQNQLQDTVTEIWIGTQGHPCISWNLNFCQANIAYKQDLIHFWSWKPQVIIPVITELSLRKLSTFKCFKSSAISYIDNFYTNKKTLFFNHLLVLLITTVWFLQCFGLHFVTV